MSKKSFVVNTAAQGISGRLGLTERPRFADTNLMLGTWKGFTVQLQLDSAFLHGVVAPSYWVRCLLQSGTNYHTVLRYVNGEYGVVKGIKGTSPEYSSDFHFADEGELDATLAELAAVLQSWDPESIEPAG